MGTLWLHASFSSDHKKPATSNSLTHSLFTYLLLPYLLDWLLYGVRYHGLYMYIL